jgi:hypothetical protein
MRARRAIAFAARAFTVSALLLVLDGCGATTGLRRFALAPILWEDPDQRAFSPEPEERYAPEDTDAFDHNLFRPLSEMWTFEIAREAVNVNALDEVPSSSWFTNRIGLYPMTPEEVARGACGTEAFDPPRPWTITGGKPAGASPGFFIEDADGVRYLMKTDRHEQPEQGTAADAIVAAVFHAAGYFVPCNRVVFLHRDDLVIEPGALAKREGDERTPITDEDVRYVLHVASSTTDGQSRAVVSRFVDGKPLGPWSYMGTWDRDLNDVVPHERRRELRGMYVLLAWVSHWDARQENTLSAWMERETGGGYVRHYLLDFGDSLGHLEPPPRRAMRNGYAYWLDFGDMALNTVGGGFVKRPWEGRTPHPVLGYVDVEHFEPEEWRPHYWNGALDRRTEADDAWMARILARFSEAHVRALVALGRYSDPEVTELAVSTLMGRRERLLERYLGRLSPLADPIAGRAPNGRARVCLRDLAVTSGIREPSARAYEALLHTADGEPTALDVERTRDDVVCATLPETRGSGRPADYRILDVTVSSERDETRPMVRVHTYVTGPDRLQIVGLERPSTSDPPAR